MRALVLTAIAALLLVSGCGESEDVGPGHMSQGQMQRRLEGHRAAMRARMHRQAMMRRALARHQAMIARRHHQQMVRRHRAAMRRLHAEEAARRAAEAEEASTEEASSECDPNYSGACLDPYASDYDCAGGSGNGPKYTGEVTVVGVDHYGLDADGDGIGCESE